MDMFIEGNINEEIVYEFLNNYGKSGVKQAERFIRQLDRLNNTSSLINTDKGYDNILKVPKMIHPDILQLDDYVDSISNLLHNLESKDWAIDVIEECLFIGCYKNKFRNGGAFNLWIKDVSLKPLIFDWKNIFTLPVVESPFLHPFSQQYLLEIINSDIKLLMCIDLSKLQELALLKNIKTKLVSEQNLSKRGYNKEALKQMVKYDNKYIECDYEEHQILVGGGIIARIIFEFVKPSSALDVLIHGIKKNI